MENQEFNLSEKMYYVKYDMPDVDKYHAISVKDIKEFIKRLKHGLKHGIKGATHMSELELIKNEWVIIDKLAGDKLI